MQTHTFTFLCDSCQFSFTYQGANAFFIKGQTFPQQVEVGQKSTSIKHYIKHRLKGQSRL